MTAPVERTLPVASPGRTRAVVARVLRPHARPLVAAMLLLVAATGTSLAVAPLLGRIIDLVRSGASSTELRPTIAGLAAAAVLQGLFTVAGVVVLTRVGETALASLREELVERALDQPLATLEESASGDLVSRVEQDVAMMAFAVSGALPQVLAAVMLMVLSLVALVALDWRFLVVMALVAPLEAAAARWYVRRSSVVYAEARRAEGALEAQLLETIGDAATVRALRLGPEHLERSRSRIQRCNDLSFDASRLETRFFGRLNVAEAVGLVVVLLVGFQQVGASAISVGTASAAALYMAALFRPMRAALLQLDPLQSALAGLARVVGVVDMPAGGAPSPGAPPRAVGPASGQLDLSGVSYRYDGGSLALCSVDLQAADGERIAVVGATGAGKSTLAKLVAGILEPTEGTVRIGGVRMDELPHDLRCRSVALVTQEVHTFAGTLAADVRLARSGATDDAVLAALGTVGAEGWVAELDAGLDTVVGEGGLRLTPVQAQQVALARVVLADPAVAVLDEATAEAGSAGARVLDAAVDAAAAGRTTIVVAHRLSQAERADRVVLVSDGRIVEQGTHQELLAGDGAYARLWAAWARRRPGA